MDEAAQIWARERIASEFAQVMKLDYSEAGLETLDSLYVGLSGGTGAERAANVLKAWAMATRCSLAPMSDQLDRFEMALLQYVSQVACRNLQGKLAIRDGAVVLEFSQVKEPVSQETLLGRPSQKYRDLKARVTGVAAKDVELSAIPHA